MARWSWAFILGGIAFACLSAAIGFHAGVWIGAAVTAVETKLQPWRRRWLRCPECGGPLRGVERQSECDSCHVRLR